MEKWKHLYWILWLIIFCTVIALFLPLFFYSKAIAGENNSIRENVSAKGDKALVEFIICKHLLISYSGSRLSEVLAGSSLLQLSHAW